MLHKRTRDWRTRGRKTKTKGKARKPRNFLHNLLKFRATDKGVEVGHKSRPGKQPGPGPGPGPFRNCMKCVSIFSLLREALWCSLLHYPFRLVCIYFSFA